MNLVYKKKYIAFKEWALSNGYNDSLSIDKDIICERENISPKIYSPKTCIWVTRSENTMDANIRSGKMKKVFQYDFNNNILNTYISQSEASRKTGISQGNIGMAIRGQRKSAGGFIWKI